MCNYYMYLAMNFHLYIYIFFIRINMCVCMCVLKLQKNLKNIVNLSSLQIKLNQPAQVIKNFSIKITATSAEDF